LQVQLPHKNARDIVSTSFPRDFSISERNYRIPGHTRNDVVFISGGDPNWVMTPSI
jgi:hypothetical protein